MSDKTECVSLKYASAAALEKFQNNFNKQGLKRFDYEKLDANIRDIYKVPQEVGYELIKSFCGKIGEPELAERCVIEYVDQSLFQAYAAEHDGYYFVAVAAAVPALMQALFNNLFAFTNPFSKHDSQDESVDEQIDYIFPNKLMVSEFNKKKLIQEINSLIGDTIPPERWKRVMATKMTEIAIVFCITHEIGHVVCGHADVLKNRGVFALSELQLSGLATGQRNIGSWLSQAWEIQADKIGVSLLYSYVIGSEKHAKRFRHYLKCQGKAELYGRVLYAVYIVFLMLGQQQYMIRSGGSHPVAVTRATYIMAFLGTLMADHDHYESDLAGETVEHYAEMAEAAWASIGFRNGRNAQTIDDLSEVIKDLSRAGELTSHFFKNREWAVRWKSGVKTN